MHEHVSLRYEVIVHANKSGGRVNLSDFLLENPDVIDASNQWCVWVIQANVFLLMKFENHGKKRRCFGLVKPDKHPLEFWVYF